MKILKTPLLMILLLIPSLSTAFAQETDVEGSNDHPFFPRMEHFYISGYEQYGRESHEFYDTQDNKYVIEGRKCVIEYTLKTGFESPGQLNIRKNYIDLVKKMGGTILFDRGLYMKAVNGDKEVWIDVWVSDHGTDYRLTLVEPAETNRAARVSSGISDRDTIPAVTRNPAGEQTQKAAETQNVDIKRIEAALATAKKNRDRAIANLSEVNQKVKDGLSMACPDFDPGQAPPVPVPYPKIASTSDTARGAEKVKIAADKADALAVKSDFEATESDEVGRKTRTLVELIRSRYEKRTIQEKDKVSWKDQLLSYQVQARTIARALENSVEEIERLLAESKKELGIKSVS
jgi:hypothetical protein